MSDIFKSKIEKIKSNVWSYCFYVPDDIKEKYLPKKRVVCIINDELSMHAGLMPAGNDRYFITINKENRIKLKVNEGDTITIEIDFDKSKYGIPMPEEMDELLKIDDEASNYFHKLTPGKQRSLLYLIGKSKSTDIRIKKALVVTEVLKKYKGKLDFKILNEAIKNSDY